MDRVGPAGEDDDLRVKVGDGFERASAGDAEGEDGEGSNSAGDEVGVLGAIIENQDELRFHGFWVHGVLVVVAAVVRGG